MKKSFQILLVILLCISSVYAQQLSSGKAPYTKDMSHSRYGTLRLADEAFANDNSTSSNISIPLPNGTPFTVLGSFSAPNYASGLTKGGDGNYYLTDVAPALYLFDPGTGSCTLIGNITGMGGDQPNGIAYNPSNDTYYMVSSAMLYTLDINTLTATLVGSFSPAITGLMIDLCFDENGTCYSYAVDINPGGANGYIIDINTAAITALGYVGFTPNYGQGMSYDFETQTIYLSAFNSDTFTGQLRIMDKVTGNSTLVFDWGDQIDPFQCNTIYGPPCPVEAASNPNPPSGTIDVSVGGTTLTWTNGSGTTNIEVWFGPIGNVTEVYSGAPITSWPTGALEYFTNYQWKVVDKNDTCATPGPSWTFKTEQNPNLQVLFFDDFENGTGLWTITNDGGTCVWEIFMPPYPNTYTLPCGTDCNGVFAADVDECGSGTTLLSSAMITNDIDATNVIDLTLEFDNDFNAIGASDEGYVEVSTDNGATWTAVWSSIGVDVLNTHEVVDLVDYEGTIFKLRFRSVQPGWDWWWAIDNVKIQGAGGGPTNIFTDNFDAYTVGQQLACQNSTDWTTWNLTPCDPTTDPYISDNYSWTPPNTVVIAQNNDLVHIFNSGGPITSGLWYASFLAYIPDGKAGYFNTLAVFDGGISPSWGMECYFDAGGAGRLLNGATVNFNWPVATWFQVIVKVDLDNDQAEFLVGTVPPLQSIATWQWTRGGTIPLSVDANDIFGATAGDEMYVDNYYFGDVTPPFIPVEFTAFTANVSNGNVALNWTTATETNNRGFEVQRNSGNGYNTIGFVQGYGTTTQVHNYSFIDKAVTDGNYSYRLRQVDFDGTSAYSNVVEVEVVAPKVFALEQNYPNPFNPSTQINFSLAADSKVSLKIFNILGQEVATLLSGDMTAGSHLVNFNASNLSSGVYIYKLEARGVNGNNFSAVKKMVLTK